MEMVNVKRPSMHDEDVIRAGVDAMWRKIADAMGEAAPTEAEDVEASKRSLCGVLRYERDAYRVARALDHDGWDVDYPIVEAIDSGMFRLDAAHRNAVRAWVAVGGVKADLPAGTRVRHRALNGHVGEIVDDGQVVAYRKDGCYLVFCAALGHLRGDDAKRALRDGQSVSTGLIIPAEDVEVVPADVATSAG